MNISSKIKDNHHTNLFKPEKVRKKRVTLGGGNRVKGFGYYIGKNKKLSKNNERTSSPAENIIWVLSTEVGPISYGL
jgi:hypothetical protein